MSDKKEVKAVKQSESKTTHLIKMVHMESGKKADVHPDEKITYFKAGYRAE